MPFINLYKERVKNNEKILTDTEKIYSNKGKWNDFFENEKPIILEIGTGMGNTFSREVSKDKNSNFIGMELRYKRLERTVEKTLAVGWVDFIVLKDFWENIDKIFGVEEIAKTIIFFPDPWEKKKQNHKRLLQKDFLEKLFYITKKNGLVLIKTDHKEYFDEAINIIQKNSFWEIITLSYDYEKELDIFNKYEISEFEANYRGEKRNICYAEIRKLVSVTL